MQNCWNKIRDDVLFRTIAALESEGIMGICGQFISFKPRLQDACICNTVPTFIVLSCLRGAETLSCLCTRQRRRVLLSRSFSPSGWRA